MVFNDLSNYLDKHCRFRFRGGKEAYGVIWENDGGLVFSSKEQHQRLIEHRAQIDSDSLPVIDSNDVMLAEIIS